MSEKLRLTFANDMPPASVSVLTPDYRTVAQVWLGPGETREVDRHPRRRRHLHSVAPAQRRNAPASLALEELEV
ncbi:MAG: hypothetical protein AAFN13_07490, partial [Bacteroidota bacterium]